MARHWVGASTQEIDDLKKMARRLKPRSSGMAKRNRVRLRPLDDQERHQGFLSVPGRIRDEVVRAGPPTLRLAQELQTALAIELLIMAPMQIKNLSELQVGVHVLQGRGGELVLALAEHEVKNKVPLETRLPSCTAELMGLYLSHYRPLLPEANSNWLFPGRTMGHKEFEGLRQQINKCVRTRCGLEFHPHLYRHAAAKLILDKNPGAHGQVPSVCSGISRSTRPSSIIPAWRARRRSSTTTSW